MGSAYRHRRRAKLGRRRRLFFRRDSKAKVILRAWVNDEQIRRSSGRKSDPYAVFEKMLGRGNPPDDRSALAAASKPDWGKGEWAFLMWPETIMYTTARISSRAFGPWAWLPTGAAAYAKNGAWCIG